MSRKRALALFALLLFRISGLSAQTETGSVAGTVMDPQGAVIPGVHLRLISESTGATREVTSDELGNFAFQAVLPGTYTLIIENSGSRNTKKRTSQ